MTKKVIIDKNGYKKSIFVRMEKMVLTRADACRYAKINVRAMTDWASKGTIPAADTLYSVAKFLKTTVEYLLTGQNGIPEGERELLISYNQLNQVGKKAALGMVRGLITTFPLQSVQGGESSKKAT